MKLPRLSLWYIAAFCALGGVALFAPQQLQVDLHKLSLLMIGAVAGYLLDVNLFPYARPHDLLDYAHNDAGFERVVAAALIRRAIVVGACVLSMGLGG